AGMGYGSHVDAPYMDGVRTDLSFTLFLSPPDAYEGGELVLEGLGAEDLVKLPAGALVLYPSTSVHRVETVRSGRRLVAVGWIKSRVRSAEARAAIFELEQATSALRSTAAPVEILDRLQNVHNNLLRLFGE
ncbi:MAG: Fe2+-dependent dioxygenase, partial [Parvularculaceae bacterium]|nr:Fe2+-dependent dioxygenase [Parvularculaceae bacterium]